jgi:PIN domain nuclease of toxin-antitoxin system
MSSANCPILQEILPLLQKTWLGERERTQDVRSRILSHSHVLHLSTIPLSSKDEGDRLSID